MLLVGACKKCRCTIRLDIGSLNREQAIETLSRQRTFSCPGHHVELSPAHPRYWNLDEWELVEGNAASEEEFVGELRSKYPGGYRHGGDDAQGHHHGICLRAARDQ